MVYVDGYVLPVRKRYLKQYKSIATKAGKIWREHGALDYKECVGEDLTPPHGLMTFPALVKPKRDETVIFSFIVFKSRKDRDRVNAKVMADPRLMKMPMPKKGQEPFDMKRMIYGGFKPLVDLSD